MHPLLAILVALTVVTLCHAEEDEDDGYQCYHCVPTNPDGICETLSKNCAVCKMMVITATEQIVVQKCLGIEKATGCKEFNATHSNCYCNEDKCNEQEKTTTAEPTEPTETTETTEATTAKTTGETIAGRPPNVHGNVAVGCADSNHYQITVKTWMLIIAGLMMLSGTHRSFSL